MRHVYIDFQDGNGFRNITHLVKFDTLTITTRAFSDNWHYAQNEASFTVIYDPIIYEKFRTISKEAVVRIFEEASAHLTTELLANLLTEDGFYLMTELDFISPVFYGRVPPTKSRRYNGKIDITMFNVEALDELSLLKKKVGDICYRNFYIMNPNDKANSIVHQLAYRAGLIDAQINSTVILDRVEAFAPPSEDDLILDVLDALLFEYGYALNMNTAGQIEPIQWMRSGQPVTHVFNETNIINEVSIVDSLKQYDGAEVTYYELGEAVTTSGNVNMLLYQDSNLPYDSQGNFAGYPIPGGFRYPPRTNVIDEVTGSGQIVYQEYDDKALKYWTNEAIVKRLDYNYKAFESDYSGIVATSGWTLDYRADTGVNLIKAVFENRRAEVVFENTTSGFANLYYMNIYGRVLYKTRERKARIENFDGATEIDQYVSTFLFDKEYADRLAKYLAAQHDVGNTYYQFQSEDQELPGQLVQVVLGEGTNVDGMILEQQYDEKTMLFTYKVRQYTRASLPALTYQEVKEVPNVTANLVAQNITGSSGNPVPAISAKYLGRYEASHPVSNNGDWWVVYDTDDDPIQRGVWYNNNGTPERITVSSSSTLQAKFVEALTDVAWAEANGYGVAADYGIQTLFQSLGVVTAFIQNLFAQEIQATGSITGARLRSLTGVGVQRRATEIFNENLDWIDAPDTSPASPEQLRARIGRLGVGGAILMDGEFTTLINSTWSVASQIDTSQPGLSYIQLESGQLRLAYRDQIYGYLYERIWTGSSWGGAQLINGAVVGRFDYVQLLNGELRIAYRRNSDGFLVERIWSGSSWGDEIVINAVSSLDPQYLQPSSGERRIAYARGSGNHIYERIWSGSSWGDETIISSTPARELAYIQLTNGDFRIAYRRNSDGFILERDSVNGVWGTERIVNGATSNHPNYVQLLNGELRIAYRRNSDGFLVERIWSGSSWGDEIVINAENSLDPTYIQLTSGELRFAYRRFSDTMIMERTLRRYARLGAGISAVNQDATNRWVDFPGIVRFRWPLAGGAVTAINL